MSFHCNIHVDVDIIHIQCSGYPGPPATWLLSPGAMGPVVATSFLHILHRFAPLVLELNDKELSAWNTYMKSIGKESSTPFGDYSSMGDWEGSTESSGSESSGSGQLELEDKKATNFSSCLKTPKVARACHWYYV